MAWYYEDTTRRKEGENYHRKVRQYYTYSQTAPQPFSFTTANATSDHERSSRTAEENLLVRAFHARYCGVKRRVQIGGHNSSSWARRVRLEAHGKKSFEDTDTFGAIDL